MLPLRPNPEKVRTILAVLSIHKMWQWRSQGLGDSFSFLSPEMKVKASLAKRLLLYFGESTSLEKKGLWTSQTRTFQNLGSSETCTPGLILDLERLPWKEATTFGQHSTADPRSAAPSCLRALPLHLGAGVSNQRLDLR